MDLRGHVRMMFTLGIRRSQVTVELCASMIIHNRPRHDKSNSEDSSYIKARVYTPLIEEAT